MQHLQPNTTLQGGKYRIERVLGQGGFGNTYVGYNTEFEETVAIKEFFMKGVTERDETTCAVSVSNADNVGQFEEQREKFKKEARRLRKLKNEHIVKVHDLFEENGTAYYVMDYIDGESLAERMKRTAQPFSENEVRDILIQILEALKEVHQNEIWHLDLKPGNIMIDKGGNAYLIDFGASKQIRANGSMTTSTALCYTPGYAPNEQIGQMYDRFGPWTDIYALGATIYNLLTNKKTPMAIDIEEDEEDAFDYPTNISEEMRKLVVWMMKPKRKARPQSVDGLIDKLNGTNYAVKEKTIIEPKSKPELESEPELEPESESEETLLAHESSFSGGKEECDKNEEEIQTILVVAKKDQEIKPHINHTSILPQRDMEDYKHLVDGVSLSRDDVGELEMWNWAVEELAETNSVSLFSLKFGFGNNTGTSKKERVSPCQRAISAFYSDNGIEEGSLNHEWEDIFTLKTFRLGRNIKDAVHEARKLFMERMDRLKIDGLVKADYDTEWMFRGCFGSFIWNISEILYKRINGLHDRDFYKSGLFSKYHIVALDYADNVSLNNFKPKQEYDDYDVEALFFEAGLYDNVDEGPIRDAIIKEDQSVEIIEPDAATNMMVNKLYNDVKSIVYANIHRPLREAKKEVEELACSAKNQKKRLSYLYACAVMEWYLKHD